jgi:monofunctional biosynthetic peptidoglycan transglycosylase
MLKMLGRWTFRIILACWVGSLVYLLWLPYVPDLQKHNPTKTPLMELRERQALELHHRLRTIYLWKDLKEISPNLVHAVLLSEDDTFYQHHGFDLEQIQVAIKLDWAKKRFVYGGSTITQQLARSLYLSPRKSLFRKAKEALITVLLEHYLSKRRIMELYLNVVEWGRGIYGAEAAAQAYFQKPAIDLTPDEAAALASILPSPRRWNPASERGFMARRRTRLVARMRAAGYVPIEVSTEPVVPEEIRQMAEEGSRILDGQDSEENPLLIPIESSQTDEGLYISSHTAPAPQ